MSNFDIAYSSLTEKYYFVLGKEKFDITEFAEKKYHQGRADAIEKLLNDSEILALYNTPNHSDFDDGFNTCYDIFKQVAEQIKEQKND